MGEDGRALRHLEKQLDYLHASARSYDAKAQIASVGYLLTLGVVRLGFEARPGGWAWAGAPEAAFALLVVVFPVALFALVLVPRHRLGLAALPTHRAAPCGITMSWFAGRSGREIAAEAGSVDWLAEVAFEIEKLQRLRDGKLRRFMVALAVSVATMAAVLVRLALAGA